MLGLEYESKRGYIGVEYFRRTVGIKMIPVGIHMGQLESELRITEKENYLLDLRWRFKDKIYLLEVEDLDTFKGINLKLITFEFMLKLHREL